MQYHFKMLRPLHGNINWTRFNMQVDTFLALSSVDEMYKFVASLNQDQNNSIPLVPIVFVEGSIAIGKSTLLDELAAKHDHVATIKEPVDFWNSIIGSNGKSIFVNYYERTDQDSVIERSPFSDHMFFDLNKAHCNQLQIDAYNHIAGMIEEKFSVCRFYFLPTVSIKQLLEGIAARNRRGEESITAAYLQGLEDAYEILKKRVAPRVIRSNSLAIALGL